MKAMRESENKKIKNLISKIIRYKDICNDTWSPFAWKILYEEVPEGLKVTIDTDQYFDKKYPLGHFIDCIRDVCDSDYSEDVSVYELTGINPYRDIEFIKGEPNDYATYIVHSKSRSMTESSSPKWKQKILDDENEILDVIYPIVNDKNGEWKEPEKYLSFSVNKFIAFIKKLIDAEKYSENLLKEVAINLWIDLHCDSSVGDFNELEVQRKYVKYQNLSRELWNDLCDEYQAKYGRKRKPQPYIKDPTDASEIFDKMSALKYESKKITQKRIEESFKRVLNEWIVAQNKFVIRGTFEHNGEKCNLYYGESGMGYDSFPCWEPYLSEAVKFKEFPSEDVIKNIVNETDKNNDDNILTCLKVFNIKQGGIYTNYIDSKIVFER